MNTEHEERTQPRGMSHRQAGYIAIELAWKFYLPWAAPPSKLHIAAWLSVTGGRWQLVIDQIEQASQREYVNDPDSWVWSRLRKLDPKHSRAYTAQRTTA